MDNRLEGKDRMGIKILGSGTCVPSLDRYPCSALVAWEDFHILLDAGAGMMHRLLAAGRCIDDIDAICLSHFHLDHVGEVAPFLFSTNYPEFTRTRPLTLVGGTGIEAWFDGLRRAFGHTIDLPEGYFEIKALGERGDFCMGGLKISYETMAHKPESRGYRFEDPSGFSCVYSGDTDVTENLVRLAAGAHTLICECAMPEGRKMHGHLVPSLAAGMARDAGVQRLVLTHFYPECQGEDMVSPCASVFSGDVVPARDLMVL